MSSGEFGELAALSDDARAIIKRVVFWEVKSKIFTASAVSAFRSSASQNATAAFDRIFAESSAIL